VRILRGGREEKGECVRGVLRGAKPLNVKSIEIIMKYDNWIIP